MIAKAFRNLKQYATDDEEQELSDASWKTDSMGLSTIIYFPEYPYSEDESEDDDE